ncbi:LysR family transcriptional regulator [Ostreiculturibacter nitratireducens]|uniref:LysR family transcriptional regulator n=1 Tax=Ostreiculturibacter nitratireducens TaxID=3075226 RepID=UPI0031B5F855
MAIKLEMLRVFRAVAEKGSLSGASDILGRTPSAVSMMLSQLEEHLGAPLFETERKNRLTPLGQLVLEESSRATDAYERSVDAIRRHAQSIAGTVRIAAVPSATIAILPNVVSAFRVKRPEVRLEISDVDSEFVRRRVMLDEADIGIVSAAPDDTSGGTVILEDDLGIVCRSDGKIAAEVTDGAAVSWNLMELEPLIANPLCNLVTHPRVSALLMECNLEARNTMALLSLVRAGLGATILPRSALQDRLGDLSFIVPGDPGTRRELRKISRADSLLSPAAQAFWAAL